MTKESLISTESNRLMAPCLPLPGSFDEVRKTDGSFRDHWRFLFGQLDTLGSAGLTERSNHCKRILRNHGVTYHVSTQEGDSDRPWELDLLPFVISAEEWQTIEQGVIQRARLHNMILRDIYAAPQYLLRNGDIPPPLLFANPNFLRPCRGIQVPGNHYLHLHAVDLARSPDGQWWVLDDRTQSPNGLGYVLENRSIIGRIHQDLFSGLSVEGMHQFFDLLRQNFMNLSHDKHAYPRVVFLTPGSSSPARYEHSLLARHLGFTLVEGGDLMVRNNQVYLKTVEGPEKVDVIVRRVNDTLCDPTELDPSSLIGTPGLVQAARAGKVALANALGSAVVETPALLPSLDQLSRHLLQESLILPNVETWWCGDVRQCRHVLENLDRLIVKAAFPTQYRSTYSGMELSVEEMESLKSQIRSRPYGFIAQTPIELSSAPTWNGQELAYRPIVLRVFVAASEDSFTVLPGGLTKVSSSSHTPVRGLQLSGGSKDTWVIGKTDRHAQRRAIILESRPAQKMESGVPSRTADHFFWLGRYTERLEHLTQLLRCVASRWVEQSEPRREQQIRVLAALLSRMGFAPFHLPEDTHLHGVMDAMVQVYYAPGFQGGAFDLCRRVDSNVSNLRDRFSSQAWRVLNHLKDFPGDCPSGYAAEDLLTSIHSLQMHLAALSGIETENMVRGHEWRFLDFGKRLERAQNLCTLTQQILQAPTDPELLLNPLLEICDSAMTYRRRHYSEPDVTSTLSYLLLDERNPRALRFNLNVLDDHARALPEQRPQQEEPSLTELMDRLMQSSKTISTESMTQGANRQDGSDLPSHLVGVMEQLDQISHTLTRLYFSPV